MSPHFHFAWSLAIYVAGATHILGHLLLLTARHYHPLPETYKTVDSSFSRMI